MNNELLRWKVKMRGLKQSMTRLRGQLLEADNDDRDEIDGQIDELQLEIDIAAQRIEELEEYEDIPDPKEMAREERYQQKFGGGND